jgi:hypothetical protein
MYADFDTSKIRPGEPVAILGNDPSVPSGKALYIAFAANDVRRLCSIEDILEMVNAGEFVGPQGPKGEKGDKGADGTVAFESLTPEQKESLRGISIKSASVDTDGNLTITFSDGDSEDVGNIMGPQGIQGPKGDKGDVGPQGLKGDKGDVGPKGDNMSDKQAAQIEQNKTDIASLKKETGSLKEDLSTKITKFYASSQGETHLADSDNGKIQDMMVYGRSEQKQYSGKNLLNATLQTTTQNGITCTANGDGTYTLNGTATASFVFIIIKNDDLKKAFGTNEELRLTGAPKGASKTGYYLQIWKNEPEVIYRDTGGGVTAKKPNASCNVAIVIVNGTVFNNVLFKPMLTTDLTATYDDFEPYTGGIPSPNPDYPQEIKSVVNPTVKVCGKNLLEDGSLKSDNNGKIEYISAGKIKVTSSISAWYAAITNTLKLTPNTNYVLSAKCDSSNGNITCNSVSITGAYIKCAFLTDSDGLATISIRCRYESAESRFVYSDLQLEKGSTATAYEPYTEQTVALPYTLNAIPVSSGGNVTIDGQQYIADYVDVERGKVVKRVKVLNISNLDKSKWGFRTDTSVAIGHSTRYYGTSSMLDFDTNINAMSNIAIYGGIGHDAQGTFRLVDAETYLYQFNLDKTKFDKVQDFTDYLASNNVYIQYALKVPQELDLKPEEIVLFKSLSANYPTTNISINSEQLDGYTVFNYPISMQNGWNYVKQQIGDTREYIYDMDARAQDTDLQAAEAYVNSEYAVALTELEV